MLGGNSGTVFTVRATGLPWHVNLLSSSGGVVTGTSATYRSQCSIPATAP